LHCRRNREGQALADERITRRAFVRQAGVALGAAALGRIAPIPEAPYTIGHMTFLSGPAAALAAPMLKGHLLAAEDINAAGGLLGRRTITTVTADERAGTDANVKALRRMEREARIDAFTGVASSDTASALAPVAEEAKILTLFVDGSTDALFESVVPRPRYVFRVNNLQSTDGAACAVAVASTWPDVRRVAFLNPEHGYGRSALEHFHVAIKKLLPGAGIISERWTPLGTTDFGPMLRHLDAVKPDLLVSALWGADYRAFRRQALDAGLFRKMRVATTIAFGVAPHTIGTDHPEGVLAGVRGGYYWNLPSGGWPSNGRFVQRYYHRWREYPNYAAEGAYTALHLLRVAIERASRLTGGWPDDEAVIDQLEGLSWESPAGRIVIRPDNHQGYRDPVVGFSQHDARYPFAVLDPRRIVTVPIRSITAPPGWPAGRPTATYTWIEKTWPTAK
jgi:branched-chain amino acid transport system substrate-binding protein